MLDLMISRTKFKADVSVLLVMDNAQSPSTEKDASSAVEQITSAMSALELPDNKQQYSNHVRDVPGRQRGPHRHRRAFRAASHQALGELVLGARGGGPNWPGWAQLAAFDWKRDIEGFVVRMLKNVYEELKEKGIVKAIPKITILPWTRRQVPKNLPGGIDGSWLIT
ncbi:hypothetical protein G7Y89_g8807 [Cudoniella acicularis]|uniref:Uncharacterized protein n=1 Tax=Cudoniella acicularis TaxID=354080 RepID=A0A8H4RI66_9HELO|nr:hypothetical protein G7Y89_g8807 [Cudoniella acicularis]